MAARERTTLPVDRSLAHLLHRRGEAHPDRLACRVLPSDGPAAELTYAQLDHQARELAGGLRTIGVSGDRVMLLLPNSLDFIVGFMACAYAGMVAVPLPYPVLGRGLAKTVAHATALVKSAAPVATIAMAADLDTVRAEPAFGRVSTTADLRNAAEPVTTEYLPGRSDLALLQFTSGSTTQPRGVMLTHDNILHNLAQLAQLGDMDNRDVAPEDTRLVSWLPMFHDMGLGMGTFALHIGGRCDFMTPAQFLMRPLSWLENIAAVGAQISGAPNFAYDLCVAQISAAERDRLDLSSWEITLNAAEPVRHDTVQRFTEFFAPAGLRPSVTAPCYGLAEATVFATGLKAPKAAPTLLRLDRQSLQDGSVVLSDTDDAVTLVGNGRTPEWLTLQIVEFDEARGLGAPVPPGRIGEVWLHGPNVGRGYWQDAEASWATFGGRLPDDDRTHLRTGDLGFLHDGELYITGRLKDLIIVDGRNHQPQDIERTVEDCHPDIGPRRCAVFAADPGVDAQLIVAAELTPHAWQAFSRGDESVGASVAQAIRTAVNENHQLPASGVVLLRPGSIPFTTSGKVRRSACRERYTDGRWTAVPPL
ncbi:fatty acyl-AMP ligase [Streptomyces sp. NPDC023838]|uniref:fatty acyl-AMP ligase n=1 Tax=Streptomyces sp. NPDC023838 TaxID=3154325 RepID=UPI003409E429